MKYTWMVVLVALAGLIVAGCGGGSKDGDAGDGDGGGKSALAAQHQEQLDGIKAGVDAGSGADQHTACATLMTAVEAADEAEQGSAFGKEATELCRGKVPKAMYDKTIADVDARANKDLPQFMECVSAQTALADASKEADVAGLADSKAKAQELCKEAWAE
jgi:hypothetical protein